VSDELAHFHELKETCLETIQTILKHHAGILTPEEILQIGEFFGLSNRLVTTKTEDIKAYHGALEAMLLCLYRGEDWQQGIAEDAARALSRHHELSTPQAIAERLHRHF